MTDTGRVSGASALNTPRLPWLLPPPAPPAASCLKKGSSPGTSFTPRQWILLRPLTSSGPKFQEADERFEVDDVASLDDVFPGSASEFSRSGASTKATTVPGERPRRMANLFGEIMGDAAAIKGIPMPAPPLAPMSDDMQGECFRTLSSSRRATQFPLFPPVQHLFTAAGGDPSTLKAPVRAFTDFNNVEGWADTQARDPLA